MLWQTKKLNRSKINCWLRYMEKISEKAGDWWCRLWKKLKDIAMSMWLQDRVWHTWTLSDLRFHSKVSNKSLMITRPITLTWTRKKKNPLLWISFSALNIKMLENCHLIIGFSMDFAKSSNRNTQFFWMSGWGHMVKLFIKCTNTCKTTKMSVVSADIWV